MVEHHLVMARLWTLNFQSHRMSKSTALNPSTPTMSSLRLSRSHDRILLARSKCSVAGTAITLALHRHTNINNTLFITQNSEHHYQCPVKHIQTWPMSTSKNTNPNKPCIDVSKQHQCLAKVNKRNATTIMHQQASSNEFVGNWILGHTLIPKISHEFF